MSAVSNLPPGVSEDDPRFTEEPKSCATCRDLCTWSGDSGFCWHELDKLDPGDFDDWGELLDWLEERKIHIHESWCQRWRG